MLKNGEQPCLALFFIKESNSNVFRNVTRTRRAHFFAGLPAPPIHYNYHKSVLQEGKLTVATHGNSHLWEAYEHKNQEKYLELKNKKQKINKATRDSHSTLSINPCNIFSYSQKNTVLTVKKKKKKK